MQKELGETARSDSESESIIESQIQGNSHKSSSFFNVASLFWGLNTKILSYNDSAKSPKSPLDEIFLRSPGSPSQDACRRSWNSGKVGLSIVDSHDAVDGRNAFARERILLSSDSKNIVFGPKTRPEPPNSDTDISSSEATIALSESFSFRHSRTKSPLHKGSSDVIFEIGGGPDESAPLKTQSCLTDTCIVATHHSQLIERCPKSSSLFFPAVASKDVLVGSLSTNDIELSEDYTCVTSYGSNPKTTHIYGDCILACHSSDEVLSDFVRKVEEDMQTGTGAPASFPCTEFLSSCYACKKSLEKDSDIYIYRFPTNL